jgi:hypothetical protein
MFDHNAVTIQPLAVYSSEHLATLLDVSEATLAEARRSGALRATRKGRRVLYLGEWVIDWLRQAEEPREVANA